MKMTNETRLLLAMAVFVLLGGGALFFLNKSNETPAPPTPPSPPAKMTQATFDSLVKDANHVKGDPKSPITVVEFADFECPSCRRAFDTIVHDLGTKIPVRFAFHHFPLTNVHEHAMDAAIASEAAGKQGKFWPMYEKLFTGEKTELSDEFFEAQAKAIGLDMDQFHKDQKDPKVKDLVLADQKLAQSSMIQETPTFLISDSSKKDSEIQIVVGGPALKTALSQLMPGKVSPPLSPAPQP